MNRREFLHYTAITAALVGMPRVSGQAQVPEIAFTFDDPTTEGGGNLTWREVNARILAALASNNKFSGRTSKGRFCRAAISSRTHVNCFYQAIALKTPQCIMKERPAFRRSQPDEAPPPLRCAVQGFAPLRRRSRVTAVVCSVGKDYRRA